MNENIPLVMLLGFTGLLSVLWFLCLKVLQYQKRRENEELQRKSQS